MNRLTRQQIDQAEAAGILSPEQARSMRAELSGHSRERVGGPVIGDEDDLRFLRSFSDVFVALGLALLLLGASVVSGLAGGGAAFLGAAAFAYALAEYFGRGKRAHLPTLFCALAFLFFVQSGLEGVARVGALSGALITAGAMALFYARIRLPFCIALIAIALLYVLFALLDRYAPTLLRGQFGLVLTLSGLTVFAVALLYDAQDTHRRTRFADNAFWLHLLAAPLIIHGFVAEALSSKVERLFGVIPILSFSERDAIVVLLALGVITLVGLAINRRALIVSSLLYAAGAIALLIRSSGLSLGGTVAATLLALGAMIVLLGVAWHPLRNQLIRILPRWRVFPPPFEEAPRP